MRQILRNQRGFTLTEMLVVTAVLGLVLAAVFLIQQNGQQAYVWGSNRVETQQNARVALDLMLRELRSATAVTTLGGSSDITFTDQTATQVRYQLSGMTLNRTAGGTTTGIIGGVQGLTMTYYSAYNGATNTGTTTSTPSSVRIIRVSLVTRTEEAAATGSMANQYATVESTVRLRNL